MCVYIIGFARIVDHKAKASGFEWARNWKDDGYIVHVHYNSGIMRTLSDEQFEQHPNKTKTVEFKISLLEYFAFKVGEKTNNNIKFRDTWNDQFLGTPIGIGELYVY